MAMTSLHPHLHYASWVGTGRATLLATNPLPHRTHGTVLTPQVQGLTGPWSPSPRGRTGRGRSVRPLPRYAAPPEANRRLASQG